MGEGQNSVPFMVIFTDLDGTLLDHDTYEWEGAKQALTLCKTLGLPVVLVSSKTRAEMDVLRKKLEVSAPFISENGGGIFFPKDSVAHPPEGVVPDGGCWKWPLGAPYETLVQALRDIRKETGFDLQGFSEMKLEEISRRTGLDREASRLASMREFDEPFLLPEKGFSGERVLLRAAAKRGLHVTTGGRFYHIQGNVDKGEAVHKLILWYQKYHDRITTVALGDSPNDFSMLKRVDIPVLIRSYRHFPGLRDEITGLRVTREKGPIGWNTAVIEILRELQKGGIPENV